ncbi:MAG: Hpt domain-containing protein, partial [Anaeromyxobacteraceae bacterium]|nr:Hpt domain-containing protein [Anaeromyxobacteraceae bacterium]
MADRSQKALTDFVSEAQETIDALGKDLMHLEGRGGEPDPDVLNAVFRGAHSLKGLSSMFGVERMARLAHALEDLLDDVRMGRRPIDRGTMDLLLEAPEVFSRIIAEESSGTPPTTLDQATRLTDRLRAGDLTQQPAAEDPLDAVALGPEVRQVLTEYEEHRLRANVVKGLGLFRVRVAFDLATFDKELADLNARLKTVGEVISTLPSSDSRDPASIAFELLFASGEPHPTVVLEAGPAATVEPVARLRPVAGAPAARAR